MRITRPGWLPSWVHRPGIPDLRAGLVHGLVNIPDGLASGLLAGLNPVTGLYGYLFGTLGGALATSSVLMSVQGTGALNVIISDTPGLHGDDAAQALATLTVLTGLIMLAAGLARLGLLVRYVPNAVLAGFMNAVAINIVLGQLTGVTGYSGGGDNKIIKSLNTLIHVGSYHWPTVAVAALTVVLILLLERTRVGSMALFAAVVLASALVALWPGLQVPTLGELGEVPRALPLPVLPSFGLIFDMVLPAASLALVGLVQGAAIGQSIPNPDGRYPDASGDFRGQGIANLLSGVLRGTPVGGSMSGTAVVLAAGGRGRYSNLFAAVVMIVAILTLAPAFGYVAMPSLSALLILIGIRTFKPEQVLMVWRTGMTQAAVMSTTFVLTLLIPMQYAVLFGVGISVILFVARQSNRVTIKRWTILPGATLPTETDPPKQLAAGDVVVLTAYGSLFFASASVFESQLPLATEQSRGAVVVLRLRGKEELGSTFINTITRYHALLAAVGGHLVLTGLNDRLLNQLRKTGALDRLGADNVFAATPTVGESLQAGLRRADELQKL